jgi:anthranilate synthase component 2
MSDRLSILLVDNLDSFTFNIVEYLEILGAEVKVVRVNDIVESHFHGINGVVISPGPGNPQNLPILMKVISDVLDRLPVLGICLGFQAIALKFGADIEKGNPYHGKISKVRMINEGRLNQNLPHDFEVVRYHSLIVKELKDPLIPLLETNTGELMAFEHKSKPIMGVQFHPEAYLTQFGFDLLKNWLSLC